MHLMILQGNYMAELRTVHYCPFRPARLIILEYRDDAQLQQTWKVIINVTFLVTLVISADIFSCVETRSITICYTHEVSLGETSAAGSLLKR